MKSAHAFCFSILFAALATASPRGEAQEGNFDPSWNGNGRRLVDLSSEMDVLTSMRMMPDNKVMVVGLCGTPSVNESTWPCIARLQSNGVLDASFGLAGTGMLQLNELAGTPPTSAAILPDSDAALWMVGTSAEPLRRVSISRLATDGNAVFGSLLFNFNNVPNSPYSLPEGAAAAGENAILVAGLAKRDNAGNRGIAVARLRVDAGGVIALDPSFGTNGVRAISFGIGVNGVHVLDDGRILLAGRLNDNGAPVNGKATGFVMRLLANGTIDDTFGTAAGHTQLPLCAGAWGGYPAAIAIDAQGRIATAYSARYRTPDLTELDSEICVNRLLPDGQQDGSFGGVEVPGGTGRPVRVNIGGSQFLDSIAVGADNKIIVGGSNVGVGSRCATHCFMVARLNEFPRDGAVLDPSFGLAGAGVSQFDGGDDWSSASAIVIGNGGLMIAGSSQHVLSEPFTSATFGIAKVQLGRAAFDSIFADEFE
ncbi:MAG: hypothetical protein SGI99_16760 [Pseudomonadota bacterium]|nr:hypothetical protein [Pseudomonadota bacterium]